MVCGQKRFFSPRALTLIIWLPPPCLQRMNLVVKADLPMMIAGSCSPCVLMSVSAIGVTDTAEKNKEHSAKIFQFLKGEFGLSDER